jgi:hypothetical protein
MTGMSDYLEVAFNNALFNNTAFSVTTVYVGLHTADPTDVSATAAANEITDSGYIRKAGSFAAPHATAGTCANDAEILYAAMADVATVVVTHFCLWDAATSGNYLGSGALATSKSFSQGDVPRFPIGSLVATMS